MALNRNGKIEVKETISNVSVRIISITEDKLLNILNVHIQKIRKSNDWITALALFISMIGIAFSTEFKSIFGIDAQMLAGGFYVCVVLSFCYMCRVIYNCRKNKDSIDDIMKDIKKQE